jgi:hypothetical protein
MVAISPGKICHSNVLDRVADLVSTNPSLDFALAQTDISSAWHQYRESAIRHVRHGIAFGRVCYEWRQKYRAQGSRKGNGFERLLEYLRIPKTTAYRWMQQYELRAELRIDQCEVVPVRGSLPTNGGARDHSRKTKLITFRFTLNEEERTRFYKDIRALGGEAIVSSLFVSFIREKATTLVSGEMSLASPSFAPSSRTL